MITSRKLRLGFGSLIALLALSLLLIAGRLFFLGQDLERTRGVQTRIDAVRELQIRLGDYALSIQRRSAGDAAEAIDAALARYASVASTADQQRMAAQCEAAWGDVWRAGAALLASPGAEAGSAFEQLQSGLVTLIHDDMLGDAVRTREARSGSARGVLREVLLLALFALAAGALIAIVTSIAVGRGVLRDARLISDQTQQLRTTIASIGDAVITTDAAERITNMNATAAALTGWSSDDAAGQPLASVFRIVDERTREPVENPVVEALREGHTVELANHAILIGRDGSQRPIDNTAAPIFGRKSRVVGCVLVFRDVTSRRHAELAVRVSEERFRSLVLATSQIIWTTDSEGRVVEDSPSWREFTGQTYDQWKGVGWLDALHPDDREDAIRVWRRAVETKTLYQTEYRLRTPSGDYRWTAARGVPVCGADGAIREWIGANTDVTERKRTELALRESEARFRAMTNAAPMLVWMSGLDQGYIFVNQGWLTFTGRTMEGEAGEGWVECIHPDDRDRYWKTYTAAFARQEPFEMEYRLRRHDGEYRWLLDRGHPRFDADGAFLGYIGSCADIHNLVRAEEALREADRRKDEFLATLSHELRNPLAPISMGLEVMKLAAHDPAKFEETRAMMERQTAQLIRLVDDLLDVSRITRGKLELRRSSVELAEVISSAVEASKFFVEQGCHQLVITAPKERVFIDADKHRLAQILSNLLINAAKYTPAPGRITLTASRENRDILFALTDTGVGIPKDMLERVFDTFTQLDSPSQTIRSGLGIGLTLVKSLVQMHGGVIEAHSAGPNLGSEFRLRLPIAVDPPAGQSSLAESERPANSAGRRVLVVDDNETAAEMLGTLIGMLGNHVRTAHDGLEALETAREHQPEIVFMDLGMPNMDGFEAARRIRTLPWGRSATLVALTGWGQDEDRRRTKDAGFDHHLVKPVEFAEVRNLLAGLDDNQA